MARTVWNEWERRELLDRVGRLSADTRPRWGRMDAPRMVAHLTAALRMATGELPVKPKPGPFKRWPVNVLVMFYMPWPKGAPTAPELKVDGADTLGHGIDDLRAAMELVVVRGLPGPWAEHPAFGRLTGEQWGRLIRRHMDHHLTQFGV